MPLTCFSLPHQALSMLLNGSPFVFVIDLAALASRREYLKLDKWLKDKLKEHQVFLKKTRMIKIIIIFFYHSYLLKYVYSMDLFFIRRRNLPKHVLSFCDAVVPIYWVCPWTKNFQRVFSYHRKQLLLCFPVCSHFWGKYDKR